MLNKYCKLELAIGATLWLVIGSMILWSWYKTKKEDPLPIESPSQYEIQLNHRRETWIASLEWCESRGFNDAVNPKDRDGTPSWYTFQFKPETFLSYGLRYGFLATSTTEIQVMELMKDYNLTKKIVYRMIDDPKVVWKNEFPDCVNKYVGLPPIK